MHPEQRKWMALILAAALFLSWFPNPVRAEEAPCFEKITEETALVSGQYVLLSSEGFAPGALAEGWLTPVQPVMDGDVLTGAEGGLWTLDISPEGVLLTDPAGVPVAPGESDETGLVSGAYRWRVSFADGLFSFHGAAGETAVTLARCDDLGFRAYDDRLIGALYDGGFTLYRLTEQEEAPGDPTEESTDPSEDPTDPSEDPTDPSEDPTDPSEDPTDPSEDPTDPSEDPTDPSEDLTDPSEDPTDPTEEPTDPTEPPEDPVIPAGPGLFFGQLHSHTGDSGSSGTPAEAYAYAKDVAGLDFLAITDHSNSLDGAKNGRLNEDACAVSEKWRLGKEAQLAATTGNFLALYGFEMTWQNGLGHISTFFTPGFQSRNQPDYQNYPSALENYYQTLATVPGSVSQFNHPGSFYGDFENFGHYSAAADAVMQLLEVVCEGTADYDAYTRALDLGWHVAPTNNQNNHNGQWGTADTGRTVVYAEALTEAAFASALANRRVYATEDADLEIHYKLDGYLLGTMLHSRNVGETVTLTVGISDPTDGASGTVEVIVDGGAVAASAEAASEVTFRLPSHYKYYYLRITQSDGDVAVTAPVWIEQRKTMQITDFSTDTLLAVQNAPVSLRVEVANRDASPLTVEQITFSVGGETVGSVEAPGAISGNSTAVYTADISCAAAGAAEIRVDIRGNIEGEAMACSDTLTLTFLTEDLTTTIVADGSHGTLPSLTKLEAVAAQNAMVLVRAEELTAQVLSSCDYLLIPAPERDFEEDYVNLLQDYLASGRTLILCGQADASAPDCAARLNALAEKLALNVRLRDDTAFDPVNNGGSADELYTDVYSAGPASSRSFCQKGGCTVDPQTGAALVMGMSTTFSIDGDGDGVGNLEETYTEVVDGFDVVRTLVTRPGQAVLVAREQTSFGGSVYFSGGMFLGDDALDPGGKNPWDTPNGNAELLQSILNIRRQTLEVISIAQARNAAEGETLRIRGHVTAGTSIEGNRFPNMIYVQDETGGLGILDVADSGISLGTPVELYLIRKADGFHLLHRVTSEGTAYNHQPRTLSCADAANYDLYPEMLVQAQGKVVSVTLTEDGQGVSAFTLEDREGSRVTVSIESQIKSASTGKNTLAQIVREDNWICAVGIQYRSGGKTVLRVRNCDEILLIRETEKVYRVVDGAYTRWIRKGGKSVYMEVEGPAEEFLGIEVDGEMIDQSHYQTTLHGNLFFRIWPRYLNTLSLGKHSVVFKFRSGQAEALLEVRSQSDIPETGDTTRFWIGAMLASGAILLSRRRKRAMR